MAVAGKLRHRIEIQSVVFTKDAVGGVVENFAKFADAWAEIQPITGEEFFESQRVDAELTHRIRMRHIDGIEPKFRVLFGARVFDIQRVMQMQERGFDIVLIVRELIQ